MAITTCPTCGKPRDGWERVCSSCGHDYWKAAEGAAQPAASAPAALESKRSSPVAFILSGLVALALVVGGYLYLSGQSDRILSDVANELDGGAPTAEIPPAGQVWFGSSFDTDTFELSGRTTRVGIHEAVAIIATLLEPTEGSELAMRVYLDGQLVNNVDANAEEGVGDLWGWSAGPFFTAGQWRYEIVDIGGNVLASGEVEATE